MILFRTDFQTCMVKILVWRSLMFFKDARGTCQHESCGAQSKRRIEKRVEPYRALSMGQVHGLHLLGTGRAYQAPSINRFIECFFPTDFLQTQS